MNTHTQSSTLLSTHSHNTDTRMHTLSVSLSLVLILLIALSTFAYFSQNIALNPWQRAQARKCTERFTREGICLMEVTGYEYSPELGRCHVVTKSGCSFTSPFKSYDECKQSCEDDAQL